MSSGFAENLVSEQIFELEQEDACVAKSVSLPFETVAKVVDLSVPLRRPKKRGPARDADALEAELQAWDAASDEAFDTLDGLE